MEFINERPIVADDDHNRVLKTRLNEPWIERFSKKTRHSKPKAKKAVKKIKVLHKAFTKGDTKVPLSRAERVFRNIARDYQGGKGGKGATFPARAKDEDIIQVDEKYNPLKPMDPRTAVDPVILAMKKRRKARLQRATHGDAPPIFPDNMDSDMNEANKESHEEMFPKLRDIPKLTQDLSPAQKIIWNRAMNKPSSARKTWRSPSQARKLAKRLADSVIYERDERREGGGGSSPTLIKNPRFAQRGRRTVRTVKRPGGLTGSDSYRPQSQHATLVKNQPWRMAEKLRGLLAMWRKKGGGTRQVVKNIPVAPKFGTKTIQKLDKPKKETDLKHNNR